ncbi:MAG: GNAT family N-acetyltransferase, partial [Bacteroidota bacterium]
MQIEFKRLSEVDKKDIINLMNHPLVRRQMPLLVGHFDEQRCDNFISAKEQLWQEHGYGPWAFLIDGQFAGWGGLQPEQGEVDLALVLHPDYWGTGKAIYRKIISFPFKEMDFDSIT